MGNYSSRRPGMLQAWQMRAAEMMFAGSTNEAIIDELWPGSTKSQRIYKGKKLKKLCEDETFLEYYRSLTIEFKVHNLGRALSKLSEQIDSEKEWLANKAANDIITQSKDVLTGADDNSVVIKVEGMPELGVPEE